MAVSQERKALDLPPAAGARCGWTRVDRWPGRIDNLYMADQLAPIHVSASHASPASLQADGVALSRVQGEAVRQGLSRPAPTDTFESRDDSGSGAEPFEHEAGEPHGPLEARSRGPSAGGRRRDPTDDASAGQEGAAAAYHPWQPAETSPTFGGATSDHSSVSGIALDTDRRVRLEDGWQGWRAEMSPRPPVRRPQAPETLLPRSDSGPISSRPTRAASPGSSRPTRPPATPRSPGSGRRRRGRRRSRPTGARRSRICWAPSRTIRRRRRPGRR